MATVVVKAVAIRKNIEYSNKMPLKPNQFLDYQRQDIYLKYSTTLNTKIWR